MPAEGNKVRLSRAMPAATSTFVVFMTPQYTRALKSLYAKGGRSAAAAMKADGIVAGLAGTEQADFAMTGRLTINGEYRIQDCYKFDVGGAFRAVFIRKGSSLIFIHIGKHDDCFRWIEHHRDLRFDDLEARTLTRVLPEEPPADDGLPDDVRMEQEYVRRHEAELMKQIDDETLKRIFGGAAPGEPPG